MPTFTSGFPARFQGICGNCHKSIQIGQYISWNRRGQRKSFHIDCQNPDAKPNGNGTTLDSVIMDEVKNNWSDELHNAAMETRITVKETSGKPSTAQDAIANLALAILPLIQQDLNAKLDENAVRAIVASEIGNTFQPLTIEVKQSGKQTVQIESAHTMLPKLLYLTSKGEHAYLYGPPGSGKSTAAKQIATALQIEFGYISLNPQTPDSRLMGYMDATGNYRDTVFYRLYKDGGIFCIDEMDNASPSLLTTLNSCLENGHASFPIGMVPKHPNFVLIGTGNTSGKGANLMFPERRPFDAAFAERFTYLEWTYDEKLEKVITLAINPDAEKWLLWVQIARRYAQNNFPRLLLTPRASFKGAKYLLDSDWSMEEIAHATVFKGIDKDTVQSVLTANPLPKVGR